MTRKHTVVPISAWNGTSHAAEGAPDHAAICLLDARGKVDGGLTDGDAVREDVAEVQRHRVVGRAPASATRRQGGDR